MTEVDDRRPSIFHTLYMQVYAANFFMTQTSHCTFANDSQEWYDFSNG